jgi:hypothetical protein
MNFRVIVPWHNHDQIESFLGAWGVSNKDPSWLYLQQDKNKEGCALTKNAGIRRAIDDGAEFVIVLDDDCYPDQQLGGPVLLDELASDHIRALSPQTIDLFEPVTVPQSRGTPYLSKSIALEVAASMGFWTEVGDYAAPEQLVFGQCHPMTFRRVPIFGRYFPLCGMNLAFRASRWPWCQFINVPRYDDIWQGLIWQKNAYANNMCFNLAGPIVRHSRQSNVWKNLKIEAANAEANETLWKEVFMSNASSYCDLCELIQKHKDACS